MMLIRNKLQVMIAAVSLFAVSLYAAADWLQSRQNGQRLDLSMDVEAGEARANFTAFRLLPESVMTGLCWRSGDGSRQGIFKDVNDGITQWREEAPNIHMIQTTAARHSVENKMPDQQRLLNQLKELSFEPYDFSMTEQTARISGILTIASHSHQIILDLVKPNNPLNMEQDLIEINTSTAISRYQPVHDVYATKQDIDLCLSMQAARNTVTPALSFETPLMVSNNQQ
jgi:hypothetical protein